MNNSYSAATTLLMTDYSNGKLTALLEYFEEILNFDYTSTPPLSYYTASVIL